MKASLHLGAGKALHNDRDFDISKAPHIDQDKVSLNRCIILSPDPAERAMSFEAYEHLYYEQHYSESLTATNDRYVAQRHPDRVRTMDDWYSTYKPTEAILQIGSIDDHPEDPKILERSLVEWHKRVSDLYPQVHMLDIAVHYDEATPHVHARFVIEGHDKDGHIKPLKAQGLREMGIERPDMSKPEGRYNSPLMSFTSQLREILYQEIELQGQEIDREPRLDQQHLDTLTYKRQQIATDIQRLDAERELKAEEAQTLATDVEQRKAEIRQQEEALKGRELQLEDLRTLQQRRVWTQQDKDDVIKTAAMAARRAQEAAEARRQLKPLQRDVHRLEEQCERQYEQIEALQSQPLDEMDRRVVQARMERLEAEAQQLRDDIRVRDTFIRERGMMEVFKDYVHDIGYKLKIAVEEIKHGLHMSI